MSVILSSRRFFRLLVVFSLSFLLLHAAPVGAVKGYVKDASGASVQGAALTLRDEKTGVQTTTQSDTNGLYQFLNLNPSVYSISVSANGFSGREAKNITVLVGQIVPLDIDLSVAAVSQSIEVSAASEVLQTEKASTGTNITDKLVGNLPLVNRRFNDLAILTPGVSFAAPGSQAGAFASAGTRSQSTNWQIDGANAIDPNVNGPTSSYRIAEAVQEFSVETTAYSAEFGRGSGAAVNVVTKSGTNQFHGSLFEFARNDAFQATDFFTNKLGGKKNILRYNQYGGSIGGPIWKDKTFFFYSFERADQNAPTASTAVVPTLAQRASVLDPIAQQSVAVLSLANGSKRRGWNNEFRRQHGIADEGQYAFHSDRPCNRQFRPPFRPYINYSGDTVSGGTLPTTGGTTNSPSSQNAVFSDVHTFSPNFISEGTDCILPQSDQLPRAGRERQRGNDPDGWALRSAAWSPDDTALAVVLQETGWDHVYLIPANGGKPKPLSAGEFDEESPAFSPDGKTIAVASNRKIREASSIWVLPVNGSPARRWSADAEPGVAAAPEWSPDGKKIYFHHSSPRESTDLIVANADGAGAAQYLTHTLPAYLNGLQTPKKVSYKSQDGTEISALLYQPREVSGGKTVSRGALDPWRSGGAGSIPS